MIEPATSMNHTELFRACCMRANWVYCRLQIEPTESDKAKKLRGAGMRLRHSSSP